jgi:hypothetical protein
MFLFAFVHFLKAIISRNLCFVRALIQPNESNIAGKTLIKVGPNEMAESDHAGTQIEHLNKTKSGSRTGKSNSAGLP